MPPAIARTYPELGDITWLRAQIAQHTDAEIAASLGLSVRTIIRARHRLGLRRRQWHPGELALTHAGGDHDVIDTLAEGLVKCPACRQTFYVTYVRHRGAWHAEECGRLRYQVVEVRGQERRLLCHEGCGVPVAVLRAPGEARACCG